MMTSRLIPFSFVRMPPLLTCQRRLSASGRYQPHFVHALSSQVMPA